MIHVCALCDKMIFLGKMYLARQGMLMLHHPAVAQHLAIFQQLRPIHTRRQTPGIQQFGCPLPQGIRPAKPAQRIRKPQFIPGIGRHIHFQHHFYPFYKRVGIQHKCKISLQFIRCHLHIYGKRKHSQTTQCILNGYLVYAGTERPDGAAGCVVAPLKKVGRGTTTDLLQTDSAISAACIVLNMNTIYRNGRADYNRRLYETIAAV